MLGSSQPPGLARQAPLSMGFSRQEYGVGCHFFLQGIFQIQDRTQISCITDRFFTIWAMGEAVTTRFGGLKPGRDGGVMSYQRNSWSLSSVPAWHRASKTLGISWVRGVTGTIPSVIHNKPLSTTPQFMLVRWLLAGERGPRQLQDGTGSRKNLEAWNFQPCLSNLQGRGRGWWLS